MSINVEVDLYYDFLSEGGKILPKVKEFAQANNLLDNLRAIVKSVRQTGIQVIIVPHKRWEPTSLKHYQKKINKPRSVYALCSDKAA